jgi:hypothetical protein
MFAARRRKGGLMRGVYKRFRRVAAMLALLTVLVAPGAVADEGSEDWGLGEELERARQFVMEVLARFSIPPG